MRGNTGYTCEKKKTDIPLGMLSMSLCHAGLQQQVKSANWNLFAYAKEQ